MSTSSVVTLATIRLQAQQRADMENSNFLSPLEWNQNITNSYKELVDLLVSAYGNNYFIATPYTFVTDGTTQFYSLPTDFYKLLGVDLKTGGACVSLKPFNFSERNNYAVPNTGSFYGATNLRYRLNGSQLWLNPTPSAGQTVQLWYVPEPANLTNDSDTLDGISGWEEYVIVDAAIKALVKEESDISTLAAIKGALTVRIQTMAQNRDAGSPARVSDNSQVSSYAGYEDSFHGF